MGTSNHPQVSTLILFGYLITILLWVVEIGLFVMQTISPKKPGAFVLVGILLVTGGLTALLTKLAKKDLDRLKASRGRVELSAFQGFLVTVFMIVFSLSISWLGSKIWG